MLLTQSAFTTAGQMILPVLLLWFWNRFLWWFHVYLLRFEGAQGNIVYGIIVDAVCGALTWHPTVNAFATILTALRLPHASLLGTGVRGVKNKPLYSVPDQRSIEASSAQPMNALAEEVQDPQSLMSLWILLDQLPMWWLLEIVKKQYLNTY